MVAPTGTSVSAPAARTVRVGDLDVRATLSPFGVFRRDPTHRWWPGGFARAVITPAGPGTVRFEWSRAGEVVVSAWGSGAQWLLDAAPGWLGAHDDPSGFDAVARGRLLELWRRLGDFRLAASGVIWQELAFAVVGQRVTTQSASESWRRMVQRYGEPAPGPLRLVLPPTPERLAAVSYVELHHLNVERRRADALRLAARRADRLEEAATMPIDAALERLTVLSGLGIWTATSTTAASHGDPDAVVIGDYGIPTMVSYAFTGSSARVDDARMLELLAPFAGQRWRVVRLLYRAGIRAPRRAPRAWNPRIDRL